MMAVGDGSHLDSTFEFSFMFPNTDDVFRELFAGRDPFSFNTFEDSLENFFGNWRDPQGSRSRGMWSFFSTLNWISIFWKWIFFFWYRMYFNQVTRSQGTHFLLFLSFGGSGMENFNLISTSTKMVNSRQTTTKRIVKKGKKLKMTAS